MSENKRARCSACQPVCEVIQLYGCPSCYKKDGKSPCEAKNIEGVGIQNIILERKLADTQERLSDALQMISQMKDLVIELQDAIDALEEDSDDSE